MQGVITSKRVEPKLRIADSTIPAMPAYNKFGVPFVQLLEQERAANERYIAKLTEALEMWQLCVTQGGKAKDETWAQMYREAAAATRRVLA